MTKGELHLILDDDSRKLTLNELQEVIYQLKLDVYDEALKLDVNN